MPLRWVLEMVLGFVVVIGASLALEYGMRQALGEDFNSMVHGVVVAGLSLGLAIVVPGVRAVKRFRKARAELVLAPAVGRRNPYLGLALGCSLVLAGMIAYGVAMNNALVQRAWFARQSEAKIALSAIYGGEKAV